MRRLFVAFFLLATLLSPAAEKRKQARPPELQILEASVRREEGDVKLDVRVKNSGTKPIAGLVLLFDFLAPGNRVITTKRTEPEDGDVLEPGDEAEFNVRVADPVRAVHVRINSEDKDARELRVGNAGPFAIE
jgi:hypothetical protein